MFQITSRLEINLNTGKNMVSDATGLPTFLVKSRIPTVVVEPSLLEPVCIERARFGGQYKIISAVDFRTGKNFALDKFLELPRMVFETDGLEVLVTPDRTDKESLNELRAIRDYITRLNPLMELRWVLGLRTRELKSIQHFFKYFKDVPAQYIRIDPNVENPVPIKTLEEQIALVKQHCATPIKIGGDLSLSTIRQFLPIVGRFDVSVNQAKKIIKELQEENTREWLSPKPIPDIKIPEETISDTTVKSVNLSDPNIKVTFEEDNDGDY